MTMVGNSGFECPGVVIFVGGFISRTRNRCCCHREHLALGIDVRAVCLQTSNL